MQQWALHWFISAAMRSSGSGRASLVAGASGPGGRGWQCWMALFRDESGPASQGARLMAIKQPFGHSALRLKRLAPRHTAAILNSLSHGEMHMRILTAGALAVLLISSGAASAQMRAQPVYGELGYTWTKISGSGVDLKPGVVRGIVGYEFHPNFALEGMLGFGANDDTQAVRGVNVTAKIEHTLGLYVKPKITPVPNFDLFARVGYADTRVKLSGLGVSSTESKGDWSYGAGLSYSFGKAYTGLDYMRYYDKDGVTADGVTLSVGYRF